MTLSSFAERLTFLRESKDLKKKDLAKILNLSASCISQYEKGTSLPGYDTLSQISHYFGVTIDYLVGNELSTLELRLESPYYKDVTNYALLKACKDIPDDKRHILLDLITSLRREPESTK